MQQDIFLLFDANSTNLSFSFRFLKDIDFNNNMK